MAKKELKEQLKSLEGYINDIPFVIDPCRLCKHLVKQYNSVLGYSDKCKECCYYYDSKFEVEV